MSARTKAAFIVGVVVVMIWIGGKLGGAVESLGAEIQGNRAAAMAGK
jgi:hypothetical protein